MTHWIITKTLLVLALFGLAVNAIAAVLTALSVVKLIAGV